MFTFGLRLHKSCERLLSELYKNLLLVQISTVELPLWRSKFILMNVKLHFMMVFFLLLTIVHTSRVCHNNKISGKDCKTPSVKQRCCHEQTWIFTSKKRFHWGMYNEVVSTLRCHYTRFSHTLKLDQGIIFLIFFSGANVFGGCWRFSSTGWWKGCQVINIP